MGRGDHHEIAALQLLVLEQGMPHVVAVLLTHELGGDTLVSVHGSVPLLWSAQTPG